MDRLTDPVLAAGSLALYRVFVVAGAIAGITLIVRDSARWKLSRDHRIGILLSTFAGGLVGSAIPAFLAGGPVMHSATTHLVGPKSILGGLIAGFGAVAIYKRVYGLRGVETADAFARGTPLLMAIGRIGCFFGHCCYGRVIGVAPGLDFGDGQLRLPVQLVESAAMFGVFAVMHALHRRDALPDRRLFVFFAIYGLLRFHLEFLRESIAAAPLGIGSYQWFALTLATVGLFQVWKRSRTVAALAS